MAINRQVVSPHSSTSALGCYHPLRHSTPLNSSADPWPDQPRRVSPLPPSNRATIPCPPSKGDPPLKILQRLTGMASLEIFTDQRFKVSPFLLTGGRPWSVRLQTGQGAPAAPQQHVRGPPSQAMRTAPPQISDAG